MNGSNRTIVFGRIVSVNPGVTVTWFVTTYVVSSWPHVVSRVIGPETYVVAEARGETATRPAIEISAIAKTIRTLCVRGLDRTVCMDADTPVPRGVVSAAFVGFVRI